MKTSNGVDIIGDERVIQDLHHKVVVGRNGKPRKRILFVLGGGKAGIVTAERLHALSESGISADHFDLIVAISAGTYNTLAFSSRQTAMLHDMYVYFCGLPLWGIDAIQTLVNEVKDRLDREAFENCNPEILFGVSDLFGNLTLHGAKRSDNLFDLLYAASAIPPFSFGRQICDRVAYDGAFAHPCPIQGAIRKARTGWEADVEMDLILLSNRPEPKHLPALDPIVYWASINMVLRWWAPYLCTGANSIDEKITDVVDMFRKPRARSRFRTCAWFPQREHYLSPIEMGVRKLKSVGAAVRAETEQFLESTRPVLWV
jgi:hypothetical protein